MVSGTKPAVSPRYTCTASVQLSWESHFKALRQHPKKSSFPEAAMLGDHTETERDLPRAPAVRVFPTQAPDT